MARVSIGGIDGTEHDVVMSVETSSAECPERESPPLIASERRCVPTSMKIFALSSCPFRVMRSSIGSAKALPSIFVEDASLSKRARSDGESFSQLPAASLICSVE
jgi:hypothetical protein